MGKLRVLFNFGNVFFTFDPHTMYRLDLYITEEEHNTDIAKTTSLVGDFRGCLYRLWEAGRDVCWDGAFFIPGLHSNVSNVVEFHPG